MLKKILLLLSAISIIFLLGCSDDDVTNPGDDGSQQEEGDYWESFTDLDDPVLNLEVSPFGDVYILDGDHNLKLYNGSTWETVNLPAENTSSIKDFICDSGGQIFVAAGRIYSSTNKGGSWTSTSVNGNASCLVLDTEYQLHGIDGAYYIYSIDGGYTWKSKPLPENEGFLFKHLAVNASGYVFYSTSTGLYRSKDKGDNWEKILTDQMVIEICISSKNDLFLLTYPINSSTLTYEIYSSSDEGDSWNDNYATNFSGVYDHGGKRLVVNSKNYLYIVTKNGVEISRDKGSSWEILESGRSSTSAICLTLDWKEYLYAGFYSGSSGGIDKSTLNTRTN